MSNAIERLDEWLAGDKSRFASMEIEDCYGAACWDVKLGSGKVSPKPDWYNASSLCGRVYAAEYPLWEQEEPPPPNIVFAGTDSVGLEAVIHAALDRAEKLGL
jgi:hypothetical protein